MSNTSSSEIKTTAATTDPTTPKSIVRNPVAFGPVMVIPLHSTLVNYFGITEDTQIQEEAAEGVGILLRIVKKETQL